MKYVIKTKEYSSWWLCSLMSLFLFLFVSVNVLAKSSQLNVVGTYEVNPYNLTNSSMTSDVWAHGNFAYIGSYPIFGLICSSEETGVRIIDISDPSHPKLASFIPATPGMRNNDVKVAHIDTEHFKGDILIRSNEVACSYFWAEDEQLVQIDSERHGGVDIFDVTDPYKPKALKKNFALGSNSSGTHNLFIYQHGDKAYFIANDEGPIGNAPGDGEHPQKLRGNVIFDITNPASPKYVGNGDESLYEPYNNGEIVLIGAQLLEIHDMWVQENNGKVIVYDAAWDAGLILIDITDPLNPVYLGQSGYLDPDPLSGEEPAGDGHVAVPNEDGTLVVLGDETFSNRRLKELLFNGDPVSPVGNCNFCPPIDLLPGGEYNGTIYDTQSAACPLGSLPPAPGPGLTALIDRGAGGTDASDGCNFFVNKVREAQAQGYTGVIIANTSTSPSVTDMGGSSTGINIPAFQVDYATGTSMRAGGMVKATGAFTGYGRLHVFDVSDPSNMVQVGDFATERTMDPSITAPPSGTDLTMHNVIVRDGRAYISWYGDGMRVVDISACQAGGGEQSCTKKIKEIAHFIDDGTAPYTLNNHSDFWGVYVHDHPNGNTYILGSDRDSGLWIFDNP